MRGGFRRRCGRGEGYKLGVDAGVAFVRGEGGEDAELFGLQGFLCRLVRGGHGVGALEVAFKPVEGPGVEGLEVHVRAFRNLEADVHLLAEERVEAADACVDLKDAFDGEDGVLVGVANEEGPWRDESGDAVKVPPVTVEHEHAVAMAFDAAVDNVVLKRGDACGGGCCRDALVQGCDPPGIGAAAAASGDADAGGVDLGPCFQVVEGADTVPSLDAGGRVTGCDPPPAAEVVGAVVFALDLAELERVENEAGVPVAGEPDPVVVVTGLVAKACAVLLHDGVPAHVKNGRERLLRALRKIQIGSHI